MNALSRCSRWLPVAALGGLPACGVGFDPPSELNTLRVLAVQKDAPYPAAGDRVNLTLLWHDASPDAGRPIELAWLPPCFNPPGGLYYSCLPQLVENLDVGFASGPTLAIDIPEDIVTTSPEPPEGQPRSGQTFVFFAACAGQLSFEIPDEAGALPLVCLDDEGESLGPDDFVAGYTTLFTFPEAFRNRNPQMNAGFQVEGRDVGVEVCTDASEGACVPGLEALPPVEISCDGDELPPECIPACEDDGEPECPEIDVKPLLDESDPANAERDEVAAVYFGRDVGEPMWINYYVDRGSVTSPARVLNDAMLGWNDDYGTKLLAPREPGPVTLWAVAHDNRGGVAWTRVRLQVYEP